jgi:hypothetical protein
MLYRIYFNDKSDLPFIWSFDSGDISSEVKVTNVNIADCHAWTHYDVTADNKTSPTAWIYVMAGYVEIVDDVVYFMN